MNPDEGSLRNSHREMSQVKLKPVKSSLHDLAIQFVETRVADMCIRQRLQPDKEAILRKGTFYVLPSESRAEPGFLLFLPKQPAIFMATRGGARDRKPPAYTMRMRADLSLGDGGGSLFIVTLDKIQHSLRLEDVWIWKGEELHTKKSFSERRKYLKDFVEKGWVPDARLMGGIQTSVANPLPLSALSTVSSAYSVDLIPELPGKRRFWFQMETVQAQPQAHVQVQPRVQVQQRVQAPVTQTPTPTPPSPHLPTPVPSMSVPALSTSRQRAFATPLESLPDVYDLTLENGTPLCRAAVQQITLSQQLRSKKGNRIPIWAEWKKEFGRYEIVAVD
jgi:hypothetical protein